MTAGAPELEFAPRNCPVCNTADDLTLVAEANVDVENLDSSAFSSRKQPEYMHHRLVGCPTCRLLFASPAPTSATLAEAYHQADFRSTEESRCAGETYALLVQRILGGLPDAGGALDIGAGDGAFLETLLQSGFADVVGIEPSAAPIAAARPSVQPLIQSGFFRPDAFTPGRFRLVSCFQTLEHVREPMELCKGARTVLRRGGAFLAVCHDRHALPNRLLGRRSPIYDVEHLQLFDGPSLRTTLERAGFSRIELWPVRDRYPLRYWIKLFPFPDPLKAALLERLTTSRLGSLPVSMPAGNLAAVGYKDDAG